MARRAVRGLRFLMACGVLASRAFAHDSPWIQPEDNPAWRAECGACHIPFPVGMLSARDWTRIMSRLDRHYGVDAGLDAQLQQDIARFLVENTSAQDGRDAPENLPRITTSDRFIGKHRSAIRLWSKGQLKSLSDCMACHNTRH